MFDAEDLSTMLKILKEHGVSCFRSKMEDEKFIEIVFKDAKVEVEVDEDEDEPVVDTKKGPYSGTNIGLTFESFEDADSR